MKYRKLFILDKANNNATLANLSYESADDQGSYPAIEWLEEKGMLVNGEIPENILIVGDSLIGNDFYRMLTITAIFNTTDAFRLVGDLATIQDGIEIALCRNAHPNDDEDGFGYQIGFYQTDNSWELVEWGTLNDRASNARRHAIPASLPTDATLFEVANELARLVRVICFA